MLTRVFIALLCTIPALTGLCSDIESFGLDPLPEIGYPQDRRRHMGKLYVSHTEGVSEVTFEERITKLDPAKTFHATGTIIETKKDANNSMVFSNGTGIYLDPITRLEVRRFEQQPFSPGRSDMDLEPSVSHTRCHLVRGFIALCTPQMNASSTMRYSTANANIEFLGQQATIEYKDDITIVHVLRGVAFVTPTNPYNPSAYRTRISGRYRATVVKGLITVDLIPNEELKLVDDKAAIACSARRAVFFEPKGPYVAGADAPELNVIRILPVELPTQYTVSPARIP